jgi:hypothetical protein
MAQLSIFHMSSIQEEHMSNKVSYSQYTTWANCPESWKLKYVDGHRIDDANINTVFGSAMHEVIQEWLDLLINKSEKIANSLDLDDNLKAKLHEHFKGAIKEVDGQKIFPSDRKTLEEFYHQGTQILSYVQANQKKLFPTQNIKLVGIEFPIDVEVRPGVKYVGYVDILTKNEKTGVFTIYDLKTSRAGWTQYQKSDKTKISQLLLYKKFVTELFGVDPSMVRVEYIILKRVISENSPYPIPRVSSFEPPHGKPSVNRAWVDFEAFLNDCFDGEGNYKTDTIKHKASPSACKYCVFRDKKDLCKYGIS